MAGDTYDAAGFAPVSPEAAAKADPYDAAGFSRPGQVKPMDAVKAVGEGAAGGFLETVGVVPGAVGGAAIGGLTGGNAGVGAVIGGAAGAVVGNIYGRNQQQKQ